MVALPFLTLSKGSNPGGLFTYRQRGGKTWYCSYGRTWRWGGGKPPFKSYRHGSAFHFVSEKESGNARWDFDRRRKKLSQRFGEYRSASRRSSWGKGGNRIVTWMGSFSVLGKSRGMKGKGGEGGSLTPENSINRKGRF